MILKFTYIKISLNKIIKCISLFFIISLLNNPQIFNSTHLYLGLNMRFIY